MTLPLQAKPYNLVFNPGDPLASGLVMALPCISVASGSTPDISPNGYNATVVGGVSVITDGVFGPVLQLDGTSGYLALSSLVNAALDGQSSATITFWLRLRNNVAADLVHAGLADLGGVTGAASATQWAAPGNIANIATFRNGSGRVSSIDLSGSQLWPSPGTVDKTQWHHVAITTIFGGFYTVYLNGNVVSQTTSTELVSAALTAIIGRSSDTGGDYFLDGWLGDTRIWNRGLALFEVRSQVNNPWGLYIQGPPQGQVESVITEVEVSRLPGQGVLEAFHLEAEVSIYRPATAQAVLVELETVLGTIPAITPGEDPRIKPSAPVLDASDPLTTGLQLLVPFYEGAGTTTHDKSGNGFDGTVSGTPDWRNSSFRSGSFGAMNSVLYANALYTGSGDYSVVPRQAVLEPAAFTIAAWVVPHSPAANRGIISKKTLVGPSGSDYSYFIGTDPSGSAFCGRLSDDIDDPNVVVGSTRTFDGAHAYHVAFTYDPTETPSPIMRLYVNGVLDASLPDSGNVVYDATQNVYLGDDGSGSAQFNGIMDLAGIWSRALSPTEIQTLAGGPELTGGMGLFCQGALYTDMIVEAEVKLGPDASAHSVIVEAEVVQALQGQGFVEAVITEIEAIPGVVNLAGMQFSSITPNFGNYLGGLAVTIKGYNLFDITQVLIGGTPLVGMTSVDQFTITGTIPGNSIGAADVEIDSATRSFLVAPGAFTYTGSFGGPSGVYIRGKMLDPNAIRQQDFTGIVAAQGSSTVIATLSDIPQGPEDIELYLDKSGTGAGGKFMVLGRDFSVSLANGQITWLSSSALGIASTDVVSVIFMAQGNN